MFYSVLLEQIVLNRLKSGDTAFDKGRFGCSPFYDKANDSRSTLTCDAREKLGPGDLFLLGAGGALFPGPGVLPFRFLRLLAGLCDSERTDSR